MKKAAVIYWSGTGNTQAMAEAVLAGMQEAGAEAEMLTPDQVHDMIGHDVGGVCPFAVNENVSIYLDESLKRFEIIYPAGGNEHSVVKLYLNELEKFIDSVGWIDVSKLK